MKHLLIASLIFGLAVNAHASDVPDAKTLPIVDGLAAGVLLQIPDAYRSSVRFAPEVDQYQAAAEKAKDEISARLSELGARRGGEREGVQRESELLRKQLVSLPTGNADTHKMAVAVLKNKIASETVKRVRDNGGWAIWLTEGTPISGTHNSTLNSSPANYITYSGVLDGIGSYKNEHLQSFRSVANPGASKLNRNSDKEYANKHVVVRVVYGNDTVTLWAKREAIGFNIARPEQIADLSSHRLGFKGKLIESVALDATNRSTRIEDHSMVLVDKNGKVVVEVPIDSQHIVWMHSGNSIQLCDPMRGVAGEIIESQGRITMPTRVITPKGKAESYSRSGFLGKNIEARAFIDIVNDAAYSLNCKF